MTWTTWDELPMAEKVKVYEMIGGVAAAKRFKPNTLWRLWYIWHSPEFGDDYGPHAARWKAGGHYDQLSAMRILKRLGLHKPPIPYDERDRHKRKPGPRRKPRKAKGNWWPETTFRGSGE